MSATYLKSVLVILLTFASSVPHANSQTKRDNPDPCPDTKTYTGKYRNLVYGFSIIIPAGLQGHWNSARCVPDEKYGCVCMGDHGRFIPLSGDANIEAFVSYQMESEWSVIDQEKGEISSLKRQQGIEQEKVLSSRWFRLGKLNARRFRVQFVEKNRRIVMDHIVALHKGVAYELILRTLAKRYQKDKMEFEKVIASWKLTPRTG